MLNQTLVIQQQSPLTLTHLNFGGSHTTYSTFMNVTMQQQFNIYTNVQYLQSSNKPKKDASLCLQRLSMQSVLIRCDVVST